MSVTVQTDLDKEDPLYLKGSDFDFTVHVVDKDFDNTNSPYGEFKLNLFNSMDGEVQDIVIPLKTECENNGVEGAAFYEDMVRYCPDFGEEHYLKNTYKFVKSSWMRLALHECDRTKRRCASKKQANEYFRTTIVNLEMKVVKPNLMINDVHPPLHTSYIDSYYSTREQTDLLIAREYFIQQSTMQLYDD